MHAGWLLRKALRCRGARVAAIEACNHFPQPQAPGRIHSPTHPPSPAHLGGGGDCLPAVLSLHRCQRLGHAHQLAELAVDGEGQGRWKVLAAQRALRLPLLEVGAAVQAQVVAAGQCGGAAIGAQALRAQRAGWQAAAGAASAASRGSGGGGGLWRSRQRALAPLTPPAPPAAQAGAGTSCPRIRCPICACSGLTACRAAWGRRRRQLAFGTHLAILLPTVRGLPALAHGP